MLTELLGLAGSGVAGSIFGLVSDWMQSKADIKKLEVELEIKRRAQEANQTLNHVKTVSSSPFFSKSFGLLVFTYCACTAICFAFPEVIIWTFNPEDEPKRVSIFWGLVSHEWKPTRVYEITSGGLGYSLLHPIAFIITSVTTGISAKR